MTELNVYLIAFAAFSIVVQAVCTMGKIRMGTYNGIRFATWGLGLAAFWTFAEALARFHAPPGALASVLIAISILLAVDRRRNRQRSERKGDPK